MSRTPYSQSNQDFSNLAHAACEDQVYPFLLQCPKDDLVFRNVGFSQGGECEILDGQMGVDWCVSVKCLQLRLPIEHTVQERFRKSHYIENHDLTITEYNHRTKQPSELYKIRAGIFLYGYFDEQTGEVREWVAADTTKMLYAIHTGRLCFETGVNRRSNQTFVSIEFKDLYYSGALLAYKEDGKSPEIA